MSQLVVIIVQEHRAYVIGKQICLFMCLLMALWVMHSFSHMMEQPSTGKPAQPVDQSAKVSR